jgi:hypothetical protein
MTVGAGGGEVNAEATFLVLAPTDILPAMQVLGRA